MKPLIIFVLIVIGLASCSSDRASTDSYYTDHGDWDDVRFPLIKPYEALCLNGSDDWIVQKTQDDTTSFFSAPCTRKVNIVNQCIFLYSTKTILNGSDAKEAWFVLIPNKHFEKGFATHDEYLRCLNEFGIKHEPKLYNIDQAAKYFGNHDNIDWGKIDDD